MDLRSYEEILSLFLFNFFAKNFFLVGGTNLFVQKISLSQNIIHNLVRRNCGLNQCKKITLVKNVRAHMIKVLKHKPNFLPIE